jgi:prepilin-type N-terminal cleavage/methylation domain-containing protein
MKRTKKLGFTLIELLVVISIIGLLSTVALVSVRSAKQKAYYARAMTELNEMDKALELYLNETGGVYPADVNRDIPAGFKTYLPSGNWPAGPWPGSVYDWDSWAPSSLSYDPKEQVNQISIRFCDAGGGNCHFPADSWAQNFDTDSAVYLCISGPCRSHSNQPTTYPGKRVN